MKKVNHTDLFLSILPNVKIKGEFLVPISNAQSFLNNYMRECFKMIYNRFKLYKQVGKHQLMKKKASLSNLNENKFDHCAVIMHLHCLNHHPFIMLFNKVHFSGSKTYMHLF